MTTNLGTLLINSGVLIMGFQINRGLPPTHDTVA